MATISISKDQQLNSILPNRWQGEVNCVIGPFSSKDVAEYFAGHVADFGQLGDIEEIIFAKRDEWYIEARPIGKAHQLSHNTGLQLQVHSA